MSDLDVLARTLYGEARGEGEEGIEAVACVIMNRYKAEKWYTGYKIINGHKVASIAMTCLKRFQFSCWNKNDVNYELIKKVNPNDKLFCLCLFVAQKAVSGRLTDFTNGATYYHTKAVKPHWAKNKTPCYEAGHHLFYNDIDL